MLKARSAAAAWAVLIVLAGSRASLAVEDRRLLQVDQVDPPVDLPPSLVVVDDNADVPAPTITDQAAAVDTVPQDPSQELPAILPKPGLVRRKGAIPMLSTPGGSPYNPIKYSMIVTIGTLAPDCVTRKVLLVNGQFQPTLTFTQSDWVEITVTNNIGADAWPSLFEGISIHWHGFSMKGFPWMDGTKYVAQCPITQGRSFKYRFQVAEMPGTYFWHDHSSMNRADGLQGALIVKERATVAPLYPANSEATIFLADWWHFAGNSMAMRLNRPFDPTKATNDTGSWCWVGLPKSLLINGRGNYYDCEDVYKRVVGQPLPYRPTFVNTTGADLMSPSPCVAGQLGNAAQPSECSTTIGSSNCTSAVRPVFTVVSGRTLKLRIINAATLVYMTVCVEKHNLTVVALDAAPVQPRTFATINTVSGGTSYSCVDVNTGQRADVLITANQEPGSYWISVGSQYRKGAPSAYGILRYSSASTGSSPVAANILSPNEVVSRRWTVDVYNGFKADSSLLTTSAINNATLASYLAPRASARSDTFKIPSTPPSVRYILNSTQPIIQVNGMLRWAFDNMAHASSPPCKPVVDSVYADMNWAQQQGNAVTEANTPSYWGRLGGTAADLYAQPGSKLEVVDKAAGDPNIFVALNTPSTGTHVLTLLPGQMIEIVIQNKRAGANGGEYTSDSTLTSNRNGREQHSFHAHGYHVYAVGMGLGTWTPDAVNTYNTRDPPLRDTLTVLFNGTTEENAGWVAFRILGNNPGVWPLHCHIDWHMFMGQGINIISDPAGIGKLTVPTGMPACPSNCMLNHANFNPNATAGLTGGMPAPPASNLP